MERWLFEKQSEISMESSDTQKMRLNWIRKYRQTLFDLCIESSRFYVSQNQPLSPDFYELTVFFTNSSKTHNNQIKSD